MVKFGAKKGKHLVCLFLCALLFWKKELFVEVFYPNE